MADGDLVTLRGRHVGQHPGGRRLDLDDDLVGLDLHDGLAPLDALALMLDPADEGALLLVHAKGRHDDARHEEAPSLTLPHRGGGDAARGRGLE